MNLTKEIKALNELKKIEQIQRYEKKYKLLGFVPYYILVIAIIIFFLSSAPIHSTLCKIYFFWINLAIFISSISNIERNNIMKTILELKYKDKL